MSDEKTTKPVKSPENRLNIFVEKFNEYKGEFRKIIWPSREDLLKHTITVIVISLVFGAYIAVLDGGFGFLFTSFVKLIG